MHPGHGLIMTTDMQQIQPRHLGIEILLLYNGVCVAHGFDARLKFEYLLMRPQIPLAALIFDVILFYGHKLLIFKCILVSVK